MGNPPSYYNGMSYTFGWTGRLLTSATSGYGNISFTYNSDGMRTSKTVRSVTTYYFWEGTKLIGEKTGDDVYMYMYDAEGSPIGFKYSNSLYDHRYFTSYFYEKNLQGDIIGVYDQDGTLLISYEYSAWGLCYTKEHNGGYSTEAYNNPFRYRGYYREKEIGLYYLQSRYYDAQVGRFINGDDLGADIIPVEASNNIFSYCDNSPISFYDFYGYKKTAMSVRETLIWGIIGFVVNLIKHGTNIFRIFKKTSASVIEKTILSIMFLLPVNVAAELTNYYVKHFASLVVTLGSSIVVELAALGLNVAKASVVGLAITVACTIALVYLPKLIDSVKMIVYGIKNKNYYWDKKWYGIKYYDKK